MLENLQNVFTYKILVYNFYSNSYSSIFIPNLLFCLRKRIIY